MKPLKLLNSPTQFTGFILICITLIETQADITNNEIETCNLPQKLIDEIAGYNSTVESIIKEVTSGRFKGSTYNFLADFVDTFGYRISGSRNLENAIDYMLRLSKEHNLENVHGEEVFVPHWIRGNESAAMIEPRYQNLPILGLGSSIATPPGGIRAQIIVVSSFEELDAVKSKVAGKIVVYNQEYVTYGITAKYRSYGADRASSYGALATLIRSVTPFSLNNPHTGWQDYSGDVPQIPTACITVEDAIMLHRRYKRGDSVVIELHMSAVNLPVSRSRNTVVDITGSTKPESMVLVSGHLDSWDVGEGAMDDGAGALMSWNSLVILKALDLRPKRTLRAILWTGEEEGLVGAFAYARLHKHDKINFVFESDEGTFTPLGLEVAGNDEVACIITEILKLFKSINTTTLRRSDDVGSDIVVFLNQGIPGASLLNKNERYFWYHHSGADRLDVESADTLDLCTAFWTAVSYIISDLSVDMPRKGRTL